MTTPIQTLYTYLNDAGLFGTWTGPDASAQPGPTVQTRMLEESRVPDNERILLIKTVSPGAGTRYVSTPTFVFAVLSKVGEPAVFAETYAELLYKALLDFDHADCIVSIEPLGRVGGAYPMGSGRRVFDMEFVVNVDSGDLAV